MMTDLSLWIELALFALLIGFSGFFSSSETSLFSLGELQIEQMRRDDNPRIGLIERMLSEPRRLIVTILIGNEFVNVAASVISASITIRLLGAENMLFNLLVMVPVLLLFGEITPKTLAIRHNIAFATVQSRPIQIFAVAIKPLRWIVRLFADWLTTLIVGKERAPGSIVTEDMVRVLAHAAVGEGVLDSVEAQYVDKVFDFGHKKVADIKTPRSHIFYLSAQSSLQDTVFELRKTRHTKVPVFDGHRDNVLGFVHARDLVGIEEKQIISHDAKAVDFIQPPFFVSETKAASDLFHTFRRRKQSIALTIDEYGGVTGLVTMEDLLECIFGDIPSRSDKAKPPTHKILRDGSILVSGTMTITHLNDILESSIDTGKVETIGGLILVLLGELPQSGESVFAGGFTFEAKEIRGTRIESVIIRKSEPDMDQAHSSLSSAGNRSVTTAAEALRKIDQKDD